MSASATKRRILVVDDSEICRELVKLLLQSRGFDVITLDSPFGFGAAVAREQPDLVLVDVNMPALHGGKLVEVALQKGILSCPIVFHSDRPARELQSLVLSTGASGFIPKTNDGDELVSRIEEYLNGTWQKRDRAPESIRPSTAPPGPRTDVPPRVTRPSEVPPLSGSTSQSLPPLSAAALSARTSDAAPLSQRSFDAAPHSQRSPDAAPHSQRTITSSTGWVRGKF
ncbi:response regulator [Polyangium sp. 15x6]|uniref:response regulator n=1 Tax=Polyangium sp. 15x6 TaxID=3042687 RepID=UPI00249CC050|nr:response regulator [Polyangium sp. 15x6]MDI3290917.1 response regulator [Polyangium sp. 15x6]